jgi:3'-phosphoadenosine 5'-phosphosulfate sulfotransferase (PAPS reductase)/FAD synthetase
MGGKAELKPSEHIESEPGMSQLRKLPMVVSMSGGKDSTAVSLYLTEMEIEHERVFMDTGWEHSTTYEYINGSLQDKVGPITTISSGLGMADLILKKGMFPSRVRRFCTQELKIKPITQYLEKYEQTPVNATGIRAEESKARSKFPVWEIDHSIGCYSWRPILRWTEQDVIDIHKRHGLTPNPLYLQGCARVGCWPCIFARKQEVRHMAEADPGRIDLIRELEETVAVKCRQRYIDQGTSLEEKGYHEPTFFHRSSREGNGGFISIDDVVKWSRTSYGGKQYELFDSRPSGCVHG